MRTTLYCLFALAALGLSAGPADSQVGVRRGYNPMTGRVGTTTVARNPFTGQAGIRNTTVNPWTGRAQTNTVQRNPWTGTTTRTAAGVNPMTGRVGAVGTVRRW